MLMPLFPAPIRLRLPEISIFGRGTASLGNRIGLDKELDLHLFELARSKSKVPRIDFVPKCFSNLANAKGHLLARHFEHVFELGEDGLGSFGAEISDVVGAFHRAD